LTFSPAILNSFQDKPSTDPSLGGLCRTSSGMTTSDWTTMNIDLIPCGDDPPNSLNVIIEVPVGGEPVKYEFDKVSGALFVDRILHTPMRYPANYGFVPHTLSPDGDPLDALVVARSPFVPGCVVRVRPIAVLMLEDEAGGDEKLLTVPVDATFPYYAKVDEKDDLPEIIMQQIEHFFTHYKDLEPKKWVRVGHWENADYARKIVLEAVERAKAAKANV
jgi:inorganic pyrophosphatase